MGTTVIILNSRLEENEALKDSINGIEDVRCVEFRSEEDLFEWRATHCEKVDAVFVDAISAAALSELRETPGWEHACYVLFSDRREQQWLDGVGRLSELVDNIVLMPSSLEAVSQKARYLTRETGARVDSALLLDDTGGRLRSVTVPGLGDAGISRIYEVNDHKAALDVLKSKRDQISIVVCGWEGSSEESLFLLSELKAEPNEMRVPLMMMTTGEAVAKVMAVQSYDAGFDFKLKRPLSGGAFERQMTTLVGQLDRHIEANAFLREAALFVDRGIAAHAESILVHGTKVVPDDFRIHEALGDLLSSAGRATDDEGKLHRAAAAYETALRKSHGCVRALERCIYLYAEMGREVDLLRLAKRYLSTFGFDDRIRTWLAKVYLDAGDPVAASVELKRAIAFNPANVEAKELLEELAC